MGLSSCDKVLKYLILLFNFVFFICGISLVCIGAAISIKFEFTPALISNIHPEDGMALKGNYSM